jgi:hypothetical protein
MKGSHFLKVVSNIYNNYREGQYPLAIEETRE